jgi:tetratricopeptide (TPR) repeat protein
MNRAAFADAEKTYDLLLEIEERVQGQYHPQVLVVRSQLVNLYFKQKKLKEAEDSALEVVSRIKNPKHVLNSADMSSFAQLIQIYRAEGKPEAEVKDLINEMEERVRNDATLKAALSLFLEFEANNRNDFHEAERLLRAVLQTAPEGSFPYYDATRFLGMLEAKRGHLDAASSYFDKALRFVEHDPDLTIRFESQVITEWAIGLSTAPITQEQQIMGLLDRLKGKKPGDRGIGMLWMLIAGQRERQKDIQGSETALMNGCEAFDDSENATQVDVASCLLSLGKLQRSMRLYPESERNLLKAVKVIEEAYDVDSPFLRPYLIAVIDLYKKLRQKGKVKDWQKRLEAIGTCPVCDSPVLNY